MIKLCKKVKFIYKSNYNYIKKHHFMQKISLSLQEYIHQRHNKNPIPSNMRILHLQDPL